MIKRRVLNDYITIVNKRSEIVHEIGESVKQMIDSHDNTIFYLARYYNDAYLEKLSNFFVTLEP